MDSGERCIIRSEAVVLQTRNGVHTLCVHILLCQDYGKFLGAVIAEVEEDDSVTLLYAAVISLVYDRLHKLIGNTLCIRLLDSLNHIGSLTALTVYQLVISNLDTFPALVTVHCIITANYGGNLITTLYKLIDKALAALGIGVTTVHEAVYVCLVNSILTCYVGKAEQMFQ